MNKTQVIAEFCFKRKFESGEACLPFFCQTQKNENESNRCSVWPEFCILSSNISRLLGKTQSVEFNSNNMKKYLFQRFYGRYIVKLLK